MATEVTLENFSIQFDEQNNVVEVFYQGVLTNQLNVLQAQFNLFQTSLDGTLASVNGSLGSLVTQVASIESVQTGLGIDLTAEAALRLAGDTQLGGDITANFNSLTQSIQDEVNARAAAILQEASDRGAAIASATGIIISDVAAIATTVNGLATDMGAAQANIITVQNAISTEESARAAQYSLLQADYGNANAAILDEALVRSNAYDALSIQIDAIVASTGTGVFTQPDEPLTGMNQGDVWYDTDDGNKPYRYNGTAWVDVSDQRIVNNAAAILAETIARTSLTDAHASQLSVLSADMAQEIIDRSGGDNTLQANINIVSGAITSEQQARVQEDNAIVSSVNSLTATVNTKAATFAQAVAPTAGAVGDIWIDTDSVPANLSYRWNGTVWQPIENADIVANKAAILAEQTARADGDSAEATARGLLEARVTTAEGDISTNIAAISAEQTARSDADGALASDISDVSAVANAKNITYRQAAAPSVGLVTGDIWFDTDDSNKTYRWDGAAWQPTDDTRIAANAASISAEAIARADGDSASATLINTVKAQLSEISLGLPFSMWELNGQSLVNVPDGKVGREVLRLGVGNGYPNQNNFFAIDPTRKYRVSMWVRPQASVDGTLYFSLRQSLDDSGSNWGPTNGGRSPYYPSALSAAAHNATFGTNAWGFYERDWTAADWQAGVQYVQPEFLNNYTGTTGYWEIQGLTIIDITNVDTVAASVTTEQSARINADGTINAKYGVKVDINGHVSGFGLIADANNAAPYSQFIVTADAFKIFNGSSPVSPFTVSGGVVYMTNAVIQNASIESLSVGKLTQGTLGAVVTQNADWFVGTGRIILDNGAFIKATGTGFGSTNQFIEWYGPRPAGGNLALCTEANAIQYLRVDGDAYFGGTLSAGVLKNSARGTTLSPANTVTVGPFTTNGNNISVVCSLAWESYTSYIGDSQGLTAWSNTTKQNPNFTIVLSRIIAPGAEADVATLNVTGGYNTEPPVPADVAPGFYQQYAYGSMTYTDTAGGTGNRTFKLRYTVYNNANSTNIYNALGIICTE